MKVREGWYDIEQWRTFLVRNVLPSTTALTPEFMVEGEKKANEQGLIKNGRIKIGKEVKLWLKQILDNYPSPMRRREISMQKHYDEMVRKAAASGGKSIGQLQKSTFDAGKKVGDAKRKDLDEVLVKRSKVSAQASDKETFSMKDLRKKGVSKSRKSTV
jgi:hypothetical protein